jgi:hypothetical protein
MMGKKKVKKKAVKKTTKKVKGKTAKKRKPAQSKPARMQDTSTAVKPFEVCNYFGVYLRDVFEREHLRKRNVELGEVFDCLLSDLNGAWNLVKLYGRETPIEKLQSEKNPFHYNR